MNQARLEATRALYGQIRQIGGVHNDEAIPFDVMSRAQSIGNAYGVQMTREMVLASKGCVLAQLRAQGEALKVDSLRLEKSQKVSE